MVSFLQGIVLGLLEVYKWIILARVLLSWLPMAGVRIDPYHPVMKHVMNLLYKLTEPVLRLFRPFTRIGMMDLSPIIVFFLIDFLQKILTGKFAIAQTIAFAVALVIAFTVHEFSHAWVANQLGDSTARNQGRLTLDPRKHLDVLGSIMVLAVGFGWAKPVPVNPYNLKNGPKTGMAIVSAAGPVSNLIMAALAAIPLRLGLIENFYASNFFLPTPKELVSVFVFLNILLFFFNLIPLAPLDGFKVLAGLLPYPTSVSFQKLEPFGPVLLMLLVFLGGSLFTGLIIVPSQAVFNLLVPSLLP